MKPSPLTSANPIIAEINHAIYSFYPPEWKNGGWQYGKLYYLGDHLVRIIVQSQPGKLDPHWMLCGITPVRYDCVLQMLEESGCDVSRWRTALQSIVVNYAQATLTP